MGVVKRNRNKAGANRIAGAKAAFRKGISKFPAGPPVALVKCVKRPKYGLGEEATLHTDLRKLLKIKPAVRNRAQKKELKGKSERLGEVAAVVYLVRAFKKEGRDVDNDGLFSFSASGVFNIVYLSPPPGKPPAANYKPDLVVVLEAKGGDAECKDRADGKGHRVVQGSKEYLETVANLMAKSTYKSKSKAPADLAERARRRLVGKAVLHGLKNKTLLYAGVRGGYTADDLYKPEAIFTLVT